MLPCVSLLHKSAWIHWTVARQELTCVAQCSDVNVPSSTGSDKESILDLITSRNNAQRQEIRASYKSLYGKVNVVDNTKHLERTNV